MNRTHGVPPAADTAGILGAACQERPSAPLGRRALLLAAPAVLLSACGAAKDSGGGVRPDTNQLDRGTQKQGDLDLLQAMLDAETAQAAFYRISRSELHGERRALVDRLHAQERAHYERLAQAYETLAGAKPRKSGRLVAAGGLGEAVDVEAKAFASYLDWMPKLTDARLRRLVASIAAVEAEHLAVVRGELHRPQVPEAFVT